MSSETNTQFSTQPTSPAHPFGLDVPTSSTLPQDPVLVDSPLDFDTSAHKFDVAPKVEEPAEPPAYEYLGELPHTYGSQTVYLTARDPNHLFAYWDFDNDQFYYASQKAHDGKIFLQLYHPGGHQVFQVQIHHGSSNWHIEMNRPNSTFYAEVGYYRHDGGFEVLGRSLEVTTPRSDLSPNTAVRLVTIPLDYSFARLRELVAGHCLEGEALAEVLARLQDQGFEFPFTVSRQRSLSDEEHQALVNYLGGDLIRRIRVGSAEITEVFKRQMDTMPWSGMPWSGEWITSLSSSLGASFGAARERSFFMHVNAELIIYGGTDPTARVTIDGQPVQLSPGGTFRYHFVFKDGAYHIPIVATAPDGQETRSATLKFERQSAYEGQVDATAQPPFPEPFGRQAR